MLDSAPSVTWLLSCKKCGQYEITPAAINELGKEKAYPNFRGRLSRALRWFHESHGKPFKLIRFRHDLALLMTMYDKAQEAK